MFRKVKRALRVSNTSPGNETVVTQISGVNFFMVCVSYLLLYSSDPFLGGILGCWLEAGDVTWLERTLFPSVLSGHVRKHNLLLGLHSLPHPATHFSRTYHLIPNSIFLNTAWNKPSISQQQLAEDQAGPPWLELWWKQMRVRISENLSSFRPSLILTLFSL